jgi:predicted transcriptional regulator
MRMATVLRIEVSDEMLGKLQALARDMDRTVEELCGMALEDFVPEMREEVDDVLEGLKDADEGRTVPHEEVMAWLRSVGTDNPLPMPEAKKEQLSRAG